MIIDQQKYLYYIDD